MTIAMLIAGWLTVALALLWGVLRISRRHHHHQIRHDASAKAKGRHSWSLFFH